MIRSAARQLGDVALRFRTLFRRLGAGLDGPGGFADADAWYCILEGTDQIPVAEAQARALTDLLASFAVARAGAREILLAVDEFSAVSRRLPIWQLYERARSLGLAVQVSAQSWEGLAATEDERHRVAATAEGGIWLLRTPQPEPVTDLAGTRKAIETTRRLAGSRAGRSRGRRGCATCRSPIPSSSAASTSARSPTSTAAGSPTCRSSGWSRRQPRSLDGRSGPGAGRCGRRHGERRPRGSAR